MVVKKLLTVFLGVVFTCTVMGDLVLSPEKSEIAHETGTVKVHVNYRGKPVSSDDITKIQLGVYKYRDDVPQSAAGKTHFSDYSYMFRISKGDNGSITLTPNTDRLQTGKYDLYVHTVHGTVTGLVDAHLRGSIPATQPKGFGAALGAYDPRLRDYLYGQTISIDVGKDSVNTYSWYVDGELQASGKGMTSFKAWPEAGERVISYVAQAPDGSVLHEWSDTAVITAEPPVKMTTKKGVQISFSAPPGFSRTTWSLDGKVVATNHPDPSGYDTQAISFKKKGTHTVTCKAESEEDGPFRFISWSVNVR